ncbi:hypothetical protein D3C71_1601270 [compost metagenome]
MVCSRLLVEMAHAVATISPFILTCPRPCDDRASAFAETINANTKIKGVIIFTLPLDNMALPSLSAKSGMRFPHAYLAPAT